MMVKNKTESTAFEMEVYRYLVIIVLIELYIILFECFQCCISEWRLV